MYVFSWPKEWLQEVVARHPHLVWRFNKEGGYSFATWSPCNRKALGPSWYILFRCRANQSNVPVNHWPATPSFLAREAITTRAKLCFIVLYWCVSSKLWHVYFLVVSWWDSEKRVCFFLLLSWCFPINIYWTRYVGAPSILLWIRKFIFGGY